MNAERRAPVAYTDRERVELILGVLPEAGVRHFADELLSDAQYHDRNRPIYEEYDEAIVRNKLFTFDAPDLRARYHELSVVFAALDAFLPHHFFQTKSDVYALYPEWKKSTDPEQRRQWQEKYDELQELTLSFQAKYNAFLLQSRNVIAPAASSATVTEKGADASENTIQKGRKNIHLPRFPRTEWSKVSIRFTSERDILLSDGIEVKPVDFEGMGCADTRKKPIVPDDTWEFLRAIALGNGTVRTVDKKKRKKIVKPKQKITDILQRIFHKDTDPFETDARGTYTAKFRIEDSTAAPGATDKKYPDLRPVYEEMTESKEDS